MSNTIQTIQDFYTYVSNNPLLVELVAGLILNNLPTMSKKTIKKISGLINKLKKENKKFEISKLSDEKKIKIWNYLVSLCDDEDFNNKEKGYLFDLKSIILHKNFIPIFNKISWDELLTFEIIGKNYNDILGDVELKNILTEIGFFPYVPISLLLTLNNSEALKIDDQKPVTLEDFREKNLFLLDNCENNNISLKEKLIKWIGSVTIKETTDVYIFLFEKLQDLRLIKLGMIPLWNNTKNNNLPQLRPFTTQNNIAIISEKGQELLIELLNK